MQQHFLVAAHGDRRAIGRIGDGGDHRWLLVDRRLGGNRRRAGRSGRIVAGALGDPLPKEFDFFVRQSVLAHGHARLGCTAQHGQDAALGRCARLENRSLPSTGLNGLERRKIQTAHLGRRLMTALAGTLNHGPQVIVVAHRLGRDRSDEREASQQT